MLSFVEEGCFSSQRERERELKTYDMLQISWCGMLSVHEFKFV